MAAPEVHRASTLAPVNIAVIKYWGKRDAALNLPTNSSLSVTLSQDDLQAHTTATCSPVHTHDSLLLNGSSQDISSPRTQACLSALRRLRLALEANDPQAPRLAAQHLRIVSENNFPTAAGLASSAAGFAALVRAIADLYQLPTSPADLSRIARQGSGSACRSLMGGFVGWQRGTAADGTDSAAYQVAPASHWPALRALILVASAARKPISSTAGMQATVATSSLFPYRANTVVPQRMPAMEAAIRARDFPAFAALATADSNSFHATCLDTAPPIFYMTDVSRAAVRMVEALNAARTVAAYTFDAGPNPVIYYLAADERAVAGAFKALLPHVDGWQGARGAAVEAVDGGLEVDDSVAELLRNGIERVILTAVGDGPRSTDAHLC